MNTITVLLVMFFLNGNAYAMAVLTTGVTECAAMEANIATTLPELVGGKPQAYAAKCATVVPFGANV